MIKDVVIDSTEYYRYWLLREWDTNAPKLTFIMLNPSRADATKDDPTLRRCIGFAQSWGYGSLEVVNLFGYRASKPVTLQNVKDPVGPENDCYLEKSVKSADKIIVAWGNRGILRNRCTDVLERITGFKPLYCLGITQGGCPFHPLYLKSSTKPMLYRA
ncbi:MAG: DUF1643 domain-containing protein [Spirulinaceae cyanobacterium]